MPHRTWIDPFLVADLMPREVRLVFFGDGRAIYRSWWRRLAVRIVGGVIPIWPGGRREAVEAHLEAARTALAVGCVFVVFPEVGSAAPLGSARPLGLGVAYMALRTGAPIVPLVIGGAHELYRGAAGTQVLPRCLAFLIESGRAPRHPGLVEGRLAHRSRTARGAAPAVAAVHSTERRPRSS
jgi:1-acyl-sn-glycerol-3-phosphate acyltransferase